MRAVIVALLVGLLGGCALQGHTYGRPITQEQVAAIVKGVTTKEQLVAIFGNPLSTSMDSDGREVLSWAHSVMGPMMGGLQQKTLTVFLDPSGTVDRYQVGAINGIQPSDQ